MKRLLKYIIISAVLFSGCTKAEEPLPAESGNVSKESGITAVSESAEESSEPFSGYTFEFKGTAENYIVTVSQGEHPDEIALCVEDNTYSTKSFVITAPTGFAPKLPYEQSRAYSAVKLISNDIDDTYIPDIMQFTFNSTEVGADNPLPAVSRMFTIDRDGELREINMITREDTDGDGEPEETVHEYLDRIQLYHSEPDKFIYEITVDESSLYDDEGNPRPMESRVKIKTLKFEHNVPRLVADYEEINEDNPLYFGYACWAAANSAAQYFTMTPFNISDWENNIEIPRSDNSGVSDYYFVIDDSRFTSVKDVKKYLKGIFTPKTTEELFANAPQKYRDIDGVLCGAAGNSEYDSSLGTLTFSGVSVTSDRMVFRSRQEKYDESGRFTGYTDGGNFIIERNEDGMWRVSTYRYPYSFS